MFSLRRPSAKSIAGFLQAQRQLAFTYAAVGATADKPPAGYVVDRMRMRLGFGDEVFAKAKIGIQRWKQFDLGWLYASPVETPIQAEKVVAVTACILGVWSLSAARIVYMINEPRRFGFAYGKLPDHVESGEERFLVELEEGGAVYYDILAFSRPRHLLVKIGYPLVRRLQKRFARDSAAAMLAAVHADDETPAGQF